MTKELIFDIILMCVGLGLCLDSIGSLAAGGIITPLGLLTELGAGFFVMIYGAYQFKKDQEDPDWDSSEGGS